MFKKSLFAASIFAATAAANASSIVTLADPANPTTSVAAPTVSTQGFADLPTGSNFFSPGAVALQVSTGEALVDIEHVQVELSGADLKDTGAVFSLRTSTGVFVQTLDGNYTFADTNSVKVDNFPATGVSDGFYVTMEGAKIIPSSVTTDSSSSISMVLNSSLTKIDEASAVLASFVDQFKLSVVDTFGAAGEKIDVQTDAKALTVDDDTFAVAVESLSTTYAPYTKDTSVAGSLAGDFSWALNASGAISGGTNTLTAHAGYTISSVAQSLDISFDPTATSESYSVTVSPSTANGTGSLSTGAYSANLGVYTPDGSVLLAPAKLELGSWDLNGSEVAVPYMPFGPDFASAISVTNNGSFSGDIMVSFTANGETTELATVGTSTGMSVVNIGAAVSALAITNGISQAQVNIVVKAPQDDIKVTAIYYAKGDRDRVNVTPAPVTAN